MAEPEPVVVARQYADAYAAFDVAALERVLAPDLRFRQVNPGGFLTLASAQEYLSATREFLMNFQRWEAAGSSAEPLGDRVATTSRMRLRSGDHAYVMQHSEVVTVADGLVTAIDSACSGARPEES